jgi:hypothetical protein
LPGIAVQDSLRQNELTIDNDHVLRIPVLGLHTAGPEFMEQLGRMLRRCGWQGTVLRPAG